MPLCVVLSFQTARRDFLFCQVRGFITALSSSQAPILRLVSCILSIPTVQPKNCLFACFHSLPTLQLGVFLPKIRTEVTQTMASDLQRILLVPNKRYKASGIKSYAFALQKFNFKPTKQGPYFSAGLHGQHRQQKLVRGKSRLRQFLRRLRDADQAGDVPAEGKQNDSMYLW